MADLCDRTDRASSAAPAFPGHVRRRVGKMRLLVAVAAEVHPARPSGRWVAGCCASGPDFPYRCGVTEAPAPLSSSPDGPAHRIGGVRRRVGTTRLLVAVAAGSAPGEALRTVGSRV